MRSGLGDVLGPAAPLGQQRRKGEDPWTAEAGLNWLHGPPTTRSGTHIQAWSRSVLLQGHRRLPRRESTVILDWSQSPSVVAGPQLDYRLEEGRVVTLGGSAPAATSSLLGDTFI